MNGSGVLGVVCALALLTIVAVVGGGGAFFLNVPTLLLSVGVPLGLVLATFGVRDYVRLRDVLGTLVVNTELDEIRPRDMAMLRALIRYTYAAAVLGMLLGLVNMCASLEDPSRLGAAMAIAMLPPLYALLIAEVWLRPCLRRLEHLKGDVLTDKVGESSQPVLTELPGPLAALGLALFVMLNVLILVLALMC